MCRGPLGVQNCAHGAVQHLPAPHQICRVTRTGSDVSHPRELAVAGHRVVLGSRRIAGRIGVVLEEWASPLMPSSCRRISARPTEVLKIRSPPCRARPARRITSHSGVAYSVGPDVEVESGAVLRKTFEERPVATRRNRCSDLVGSAALAAVQVTPCCSRGRRCADPWTPGYARGPGTGRKAARTGPRRPRRGQPPEFRRWVFVGQDGALDLLGGPRGSGVVPSTWTRRPDRRREVPRCVPAGAHHQVRTPPIATRRAVGDRPSGMMVDACQRPLAVDLAHQHLHLVRLHLLGEDRGRCLRVGVREVPRLHVLAPVLVAAQVARDPRDPQLLELSTFTPATRSGHPLILCRVTPEFSG